MVEKAVNLLFYKQAARLRVRWLQRLFLPRSLSALSAVLQRQPMNVRQHKASDY